MAETFTKDELHSWIQRSIGTENFTFTVENTTQKGEGYIGELFFVKVDLQQPLNGKDVLYLVVKTNKKNPGSEKAISIVQDLCKREVFFYSTILKEYQIFQNNKKLPVFFDIVPKCFKTFSEVDNEVVILENLKKEGYMLHSRQHPMNIAHLEMGLKSYAKLHAMSFALKDQKREIFENISKTCTSLIKDIFQNFKTVFDTKTPMLVEALKEADRSDLSIVYEKFINDKSIYTRFMEVSDTISKDQALIHTDCHTANMMFQYKGDDKTIPLRMALIDFQVVCLHSPIIDISLFLHINISPTDVPKLKDFVEYYYTEFCSYLKQLGSDADKVFPRSIFEEQLKIYMPYGMFVTLTFLEMVYLDNSDALDLFDEETNEFFGGFTNDLKLKSRDKYLQRLVALVDSFFNGPFV
ncbi:unnamed protein product [Diabrotica balteata]|uniref:CHK kinase-like domain-containing protein n=1 Tax=Diabrotica balteata TaxID=107213 RepID=A0A9N9XF38_DIABA|nr:unnamed protein product [Diabrotica balteata]